MKAIGKILLKSQDGPFGLRRVKLLEKIDETGSISKAAAAAGMSYKAAWDAIDKMNNLADEPLVIKVTGGRHGGGTSLTPHARKLIQTFYELAESQDQLIQQSDRQKGSCISFFSSSTKNLFSGRVDSVLCGDVNASVGVCIRGDDLLVSVLTNDSVRRMELAVGDRVYALVHESAVTLLKGDGRDLAVSARNRLLGRVGRIIPSGVSAEVEIRLPGGHAVYTSVTMVSIDSMELKEEDAVTALFKAQAVMLLK
jgi:molybdate transport system regulatory protein